MSVTKSPEALCPLLAGMTVPQVTLAAAGGSEVDFGTAVREKPAVLVFYRGGW